LYAVLVAPPGRTKLIGEVQDQHRRLARDPRRPADDIFIRHHIAQHEHPTISEPIDQRLEICRHIASIFLSCHPPAVDHGSRIRRSTKK